MTICSPECLRGGAYCLNSELFYTFKKEKPSKKRSTGFMFA
jgi:hypothetical protein